MTHPFHPLYGKAFAVLICRQNWGERRVYYQDEGGRLCSFPLEWTSLASIDPFVHISAGRAAFRVTDLLEVARLLKILSREATDEAETFPVHESDV